MKKKAVFFDRDGTLVRTRTYGNEENVAPRSPEDLELVPDVPTILNQLHEAGFLIIIISNQPDIALGKISEKTKLALAKKFENLIKGNSLPTDAIYYCYHHPKGVVPRYTKNCKCRKPKPGMLITVSEKFGVDLKNSWMIGDTYTDIVAGKSAGCKTILLKRPWSKEQNCESDFLVHSLEEALKIIITS